MTTPSTSSLEFETEAPKKRWGVGIAVGVGVGLLAVPAFTVLGAGLGAVLPFVLIAQANMGTLATIATTVAAASLWTAPMAVAGAGVCGAVGAVIGVAQAQRSASEAMERAQYDRHAPQTFGEQLKSWRNRVTEAFTPDTPPTQSPRSGPSL